MKAMILRGLILAFVICFQFSESKKTWQQVIEKTINLGSEIEKEINSQLAQSSTSKTSENRFPATRFHKQRSSFAHHSASPTNRFSQRASSPPFNAQNSKTPFAKVGTLIDKGVNELSSKFRDLSTKRRSGQSRAANRQLKQPMVRSATQISVHRKKPVETLKRNLPKLSKNQPSKPQKKEPKLKEKLARSRKGIKKLPTKNKSVISPKRSQALSPAQQRSESRKEKLKQNKRQRAATRNMKRHLTKIQSKLSLLKRRTSSTMNHRLGKSKTRHTKHMKNQFNTLEEAKRLLSLAEKMFNISIWGQPTPAKKWLTSPTPRTSSTSTSASPPERTNTTPVIATTSLEPPVTNLIAEATSAYQGMVSSPTTSVDTVAKTTKHSASAPTSASDSTTEDIDTEGSTKDSATVPTSNASTTQAASTTSISTSTTSPVHAASTAIITTSVLTRATAETHASVTTEIPGSTSVSVGSGTAASQGTTTVLSPYSSASVTVTTVSNATPTSVATAVAQTVNNTNNEATTQVGVRNTQSATGTTLVAPTMMPVSGITTTNDSTISKANSTSMVITTAARSTTATPLGTVVTTSGRETTTNVAVTSLRDTKTTASTTVTGAATSASVTPSSTAAYSTLTTLGKNPTQVSGAVTPQEASLGTRRE